MSAINKSTIPDLTRNMNSKRAVKDKIYSLVVGSLTLLACIPLFSIMYMLIKEGGSRLSWETLTALPPGGFEMGGGVGNAILGTLTMVGIASLLSIPLGITAAVYINEIAPNSWLSKGGKFLAKILTGFPSILAGVFAYTAVVIVMGHYSAIAGGIALAILMVPTVILTTVEALKSVPQRMKDAAYGLGCTQSQVVWKVVLPAAWPSIITGVLLAVASAAGESAPLLFTALFSNYYMSGLEDPTASLSILIYNFSSLPFPNQIELAWSASLILVSIILLFNLLARLIGRKKS